MSKIRKCVIGFISFNLIIFSLLFMFGLHLYLDWKLETRVTEDLPIERSNNIERIMMHSPREYTLLISTPSSPELIQRTYFVAEDVKFFTDALIGKPMWAEAKKRRVSLVRQPLFSGKKKILWQDEYWIYLGMHIHSAKNVKGAPWKECHWNSNYKRTVCAEGRTNVVE